MPSTAGPALTRAEYTAILERLGEQYSLESVARDRVDVNWKDLQGGATPLSQFVRVEERHHPSHVYVQADTSVALGTRVDAQSQVPNPQAVSLDVTIGLGFALGSPAMLPDYNKVSRKLLNNYLPIVQSQWQSGDIKIDQTAFAFLPSDNEVVTGKETQYAVVRMQLTNTSSSPRNTSLLALVCPKLKDTQTMMYASYQAPPTRWQQDPANIRCFGDTLSRNIGDTLSRNIGDTLSRNTGDTLSRTETALEMDGKLLLLCRLDSGVSASYHQTLPNTQGGELQPGKFTNCLKFDVKLGPKQTRTIDFVLPGTGELYPLSELAAMRKVTFNRALTRVKRHWESALKPSMKLVTPDERVNDVYKYAILSNLQFLVKTPDRPWRAPYQTPHAMPMTWPWEAATTMTPMISVGYARECEPAISYFTERQVGIGSYAEGDAPGCYSVPAKPLGEFKATKGAYVGYSLYWANETGSVLWLMAEQYRYSGDKAWLERNRPGILAAWKFIQNARKQTEVRDEKGERVAYYGLLPRARSHDWDGWRYHFTFSDAFTWFGMSEMAKAFAEAGLPEARQLAADVAEYRKCILSAVERAQHQDQETGFTFIPISALWQRGTESDTGVWNLDGPMWLFYVGLLDPFDKRFDAMEAYVDRKYGRMMGICGRMGPGSDMWYVNQSDDAYYNMYLARGEYEKALLVFNSNFAYCMSNDTYQAVERIDAGDPGFCPLQPNASGHGRLIEMIRRMVIDEQDAGNGVLWLLRGCPRKWFARGKSVVAENAPTLFGKMAIRTKSSGNSVTIEIDPPASSSLREMRIVVRHPSRTAPKQATVNGAAAKVENDTLVIPASKDHLQVVLVY